MTSRASVDSAAPVLPDTQNVVRVSDVPGRNIAVVLDSVRSSRHMCITACTLVACYPRPAASLFLSVG